jgi:hypothetical protein
VVKAFTCKLRLNAIAASTTTTSVAGTITRRLRLVADDPRCGDRGHGYPDSESERAPHDRVITEQVQPGRQTTERALHEQESGEKMMLTSPRTPKPTAISVSVTRCWPPWTEW